MTEINKTLYIPLYGKAYVSSRGIILDDKRAEEIWQSAELKLSGKAKSKWLAYYMGMRSRVFDEWVRHKTGEGEHTVIHVGCGLDSRATRVGLPCGIWYDVDFPSVIEERRRHFAESERYRMICGDIREDEWLDSISCGDSCILIMEGVSMYLSADELSSFLGRIAEKFGKVSLLMDCYTSFAARASKYKNPINDVGVRSVFGIDEPRSLENGGLRFIREHNMTPDYLIDELSGMERAVFCKVYGGRMSKRLYRLYEYEK